MISPAIHFPGTCAEAIDFYEKAFPLTIHSIDYYRDAPSGSGMTVSQETRNFVMHSELTICGTRVNMSDTQDNVINGNRILLNVFLDSADQVRNAFNTLTDGGKVVVELGPQFFSPMYGSVEDRFGIRWQLISNG